MNTTITLTRNQMDKIVEFATNFKDVQLFTIKETHNSGIGASIYITCPLFGNDSKAEISVNITDVSVW
jgi:Holliday junction resolvase